MRLTELARSIFVASVRRRPRTGWRIVIGFAAMMITIGALAAAVDAIEIPFVESFLWQLVAAPVLIGLAWVLARMVDRRPFGEYGLTWQPGRLALGIVLGVAVVSVIFVVQLLANWISIGGGMHNRYEVPFAAGMLGFTLRYGAVAVFEELYHRGFLITNLAEGLGGAQPRKDTACVIAALLFGLMHLTNDNASPLSAVNISLLGLVFGFLYLWTGSLSIPIGLHFGWNFALGPLFGLPVSGYAPRVSLLLIETRGSSIWTGGDFGPEGGLVTAILLLVILAILAAVRAAATRGKDPRRA